MFIATRRVVQCTLLTRQQCTIFVIFPPWVPATNMRYAMYIGQNATCLKGLNAIIIALIVFIINISQKQSIIDNIFVFRFEVDWGYVILDICITSLICDKSCRGVASTKFSCSYFSRWFCSVFVMHSNSPIHLSHKKSSWNGLIQK